jgi:transitional endoplasmic reticulum ATPase
MEICQRVAKLAIQASINADAAREKRAREEAEDTKMEDDSEEPEDPVSQITRLVLL